MWGSVHFPAILFSELLSRIQTKFCPCFLVYCTTTKLNMTMQKTEWPESALTCELHKLHVKCCTTWKSNTYYNSAVTCHHNNVKSFSPNHAYIYVMYEVFKAEINAMMDVIMSVISNYKPTTFFLNFCSKVAYMHTYWRHCTDFMYLYPASVLN